MSTFFKLSSEESLERQPLSGVYHLSCNITFTPQDNIMLSDVMHTIATSFGEKLSGVTIEREQPAQSLQPQDTVIVQESVPVLAKMYEDNGNVIAGSLSPTAQLIGETMVSLKAHSRATVRRIVDIDHVELVDVNKLVHASLHDPETQQIVDYPIAVDTLIVPLRILEKAD